MLKLSYAAMLSVLLVGPVAAQPRSPDFAGYRKAMSGVGLTALIPASTAYQPGYVFALRKNASGGLFSQTVCERAFSGEFVQSQQAFPKNAQSKDKKGSLSLSFLPAFLGSAISALFGLSASASQNASIEIKNATTVEVPKKSTLLGQTTASRIISLDCASNLKTYPRVAKGKFRDPLYIVVTSTYADQLTFKGEKNSDLKLDASAEAAKSFTAKTGFSVNKTAAAEIDLKRDSEQAPRYYIAANFVQLLSDNPGTEVSSTEKPHTLSLGAVPPGLSFKAGS